MATSLVRKQLMGAAGAAAALVALAAIFSVAGKVLGEAALPQDDPASRLAFAASWLTVPGVALLAGVIGAAGRGFHADAIEGTRTPASHALEINLRYNQNTVEQAVLAAIAWGALAVTLPRAQLWLIPAMAAAFGLGRLTFWIGYLIHPMGRAFGMVLTALPTVAAYAWLVWRAVRPH